MTSLSPVYSRISAVEPNPSFQAYWFILTSRGRDRDRDWGGTENNGFLYYDMYCTHYTGTGTVKGNHCFLLCLSLSRSRSRAVCLSHKGAFTLDVANSLLFITSQNVGGRRIKKLAFCDVVAFAFVIVQCKWALKVTIIILVWRMKSKEMIQCKQKGHTT